MGKVGLQIKANETGRRKRTPPVRTLINFYGMWQSAGQCIRNERRKRNLTKEKFNLFKESFYNKGGANLGEKLIEDLQRRL
jgi:hypothetical protein